jgi:hypothetical protein
MKPFFTIAFSLLLVSSYSQQLVGTISNSEDSYQGYTIISPSSFKTSYLINNCGEIINSWESDHFIALMAEVDMEGNLYRLARGENVGGFAGGGIGGRLEKFNWDGDLIWTGILADEFHHAHHDLEILPNGNILLIQWDKILADEVFDSGRDPLTFDDDSLWPDRIIEIEILENDEFEIVWEWRAWDHIVQDFDSSLDNFGVISEHPEKIDLNLIPTEGGNDLSDWMHINGVAYNEELDLIALSSRHFSEIFVIDHSTTTEEAAGSTGGNFGMGGDILYRYGNAQNYNLGTAQDQVFYGQHDARFHYDEEIEQWQISVFNNGINRIGGNASSVDIINLPLEGNEFVREANTAFGPDELFFQFPSELDTNFYASRVCGAQIMPNDNVVVSAGSGGFVVEVDTEAEFTAWGDYLFEYKLPVGIAGPVAFDTPNFNGNYFKSKRYSPDYEGFEGKDLTPQGVIELNSPGTDCVVHETVIDFIGEANANQLKIYPNPANTSCTIEAPENGELEIYNAFGKLIDQVEVRQSTSLKMDLSLYTSGLYYLHFQGKDHYNTKLIIK